MGGARKRRGQVTPDFGDARLSSTTPFADPDDRASLVPENVRSEEGAPRTGVLPAASCVCAAIWPEDFSGIPSRPDGAGSRAAMHFGMRTRTSRKKTYVIVRKAPYLITHTKFQT